MFGLVLFTLIAAAQPGTETPFSTPPDPESEIIVEGERPDEESAPIGSRIARPRIDFGNGQIATATGVAGLVPGSGMDPFAGPTRLLTQRECRSEARLSEGTVCLFAEMQAAFEAGDHGAVRARLDQVLARPNLTDDERYLAHRVAFAVALAGGDEQDRRVALEGMLATTAMPSGDRAPALRTLAAIALSNGDHALAASLFEHAIAAAPMDARTRGNLAALYSNAGRDAEARALIREAIALARNSGETVPREWLDFAGRQ